MQERSDEIFLLEEDRLRALPARPMRVGLFGKTLEEALQLLIEKYPDVIPGKQIDPGGEDPPRFMLLRRETAIGAWSLDHLLVDQQGVPTLVEAKLMQNPEARRAVIGQIMEYAANAAASWANGHLRELAAEFWRRKGKDVDELIHETFGTDVDPDAFWRTVEDNLRQGRIRLIIAADELRPEVRRVIEYLNGEMKAAEIFGLELRCYAGESSPLILVPHLIGRTQAAADRKEIPEPVPLWTADRLRGAYESLRERQTGERLRRVLDWAEGSGFLMEARAKNPTLGIHGRSGARLFSFFWDGTVYWFLNEQFYTGGRTERDRLLAELRRLRMLGPDFDPEEVVSGRNLARKLTDLGEDEFKVLLEVLARSCGTEPEPNGKAG